MGKISSRSYFLVIVLFIFGVHTVAAQTVVSPPKSSPKPPMAGKDRSMPKSRSPAMMPAPAMPDSAGSGMPDIVESRPGGCPEGPPCPTISGGTGNANGCPDGNECSLP